jgi:hypothetical protein
MNVFLDVFNNPLLLQNKLGIKNFIMKIKGPFVKLILLNEVVKHPMFKQGFSSFFFGVYALTRLYRH